MSASRRTICRSRRSPAAFVAGFIQIELDTETGKFDIVDYLAVADCGTVIHPMGLATQIKGGAVMGFGLATLERHIYDPQNGLPATVSLYQQKPASYLDVPSVFRTDAVDKPDPQSPLGTKGIGEPVMGAGASALLCAISDALGGGVLQPRAGHDGSNPQRALEASAVAQAAAGQHRLKGLTLGSE